MRNVVVVCLDTVRKDIFEAQANSLRSLADRDYSQARATSCWSTPSHASMFTGQVPSRHGLTTYSRDFRDIDRSETFLDGLDGYASYGVSANEFVGPSFGFDTLFDDFAAVSPRRRSPAGLDPLEYTRDRRSRFFDGVKYLRAAVGHNNTAASLRNGFVGLVKDLAPRFGVTDPFDAGAVPALRQARRYVTEEEEPSFTFVNLMDAHLPLRKHTGLDRVSHVPPSWSTQAWEIWELMGETSGFEDYWETREALYEASVRYLDGVVTEFVKTVQTETDRETVVIVTSDHGENLGRPEEEYLVNHTSSLSEGLLHVPLLIISEGGVKVKPTGERYVSQLALPEIVCGAAEGTVPDVSDNRAVAEVIGRGPTPEPPSDRPFWDRTIRCAYDDNIKTVWDSLGECVQYRVACDEPSRGRECLEDIEVPEWTGERFVGAVDEQVGNQREAELDRGTEQRLRELGYL